MKVLIPFLILAILAIAPAKANKKSGKGASVKATSSAKSKELKLHELAESGSKITPSLKTFLKNHQYTEPADIFIPEEGGVAFPFLKLNSDYALLHVFKLFPTDEADGYLILLDISSTRQTIPRHQTSIDHSTRQKTKS